MNNIEKVRHELLEKIKKNKDHFELLDTLSSRLDKSSDNINTISSKFDGILEARQELTPLVVDAFIDLQVIIYTLAMHTGEFDSLLVERMAEISEEYTTIEDYKEMEF